MLVMACPPWNSVGACNWVGNQKTHLRNICLHYQRYLILKRDFLNFLNNTTGITIFILCCISAYLPRIEAESRLWRGVIEDLKEIKAIAESMDVSLYTADMHLSEECEAQVMKCFSSELKVILYECNFKKGCKIKQHIKNMQRNVEASSRNKLNMRKPKCKSCEEYEERNFTQFIETFEEFAKCKVKTY
uniref:Interleukin n=1 Tax=Pelusios castaneus TaxID=367368 RepID=A0A8C8RBA8_9SAUR